MRRILDFRSRSDADKAAAVLASEIGAHYDAANDHWTYDKGGVEHSIQVRRAGSKWSLYLGAVSDI